MSSGEALRKLVCGLPEPYRSNRYFLMLAYFDASGSMGDSPVFVMAGYLGRVADWEKFTPKWQAALDAPKKIDYFKMSEAWARRGEFLGWREEDRDARLKLLAPITNEYAMGAIASVVPVEAWKKHFVGRMANTYHDRPYFFSFHGESRMRSNSFMQRASKKK